MYSLNPNEAPHTAYKRILLEETRAAAAVLETAPEAPDEAVHEIRKGIKRIRAVLRAGRGLLSKAEFRSANYIYRDLGRRFSPLRDDAVFAETLALACASAAYAPEHTSALAQRLLADLPDEAERAAWFSSDRMAALRGAFSQAERHAGDLIFAQGEPGAAVQGIHKTARRAAQGFRDAYRDPETPEKFHEWRKQVKYLWHQCQLLAGEREAEIHRIGDLKHLSDLLGLAHDAAELERWLDTQTAPSTAWDIRVLREDLRRFRMDNEGAARPHGRTLFSGALRELIDSL